MKKIIILTIFFVLAGSNLFANMQISNALSYLSIKENKKIKLSNNSKDIFIPSSVRLKDISSFSRLKKIINTQTNYHITIKNKFAKNTSSIVYIVNKTAYYLASGKPFSFAKPMTVSYFFNELEKISKERYKVIGDANIPISNYKIRNISDLISYLKENGISIQIRTKNNTNIVLVKKIPNSEF